MLIKVKFFKTIGLPAEPVANAIYFVQDETDPDLIMCWVSDEDGDLRQWGNAAFVIAVMSTSMALKAPLNSPAFTGTPTAPTQTAGNNTTRVATTAFVATALNNLVNAAPGALDTLKELADAINDDQNFAATMTTALAGKVPVTRTINGHALSANVTVSKADVGLGSSDDTADSAKPVSTAQQTALNLKAPLADPAFTGNPTVPNQTAGNNSTRAANTAFVKAAVDSAISYADGLVLGLWDDRGNFSAASSFFPASGGSGAAGAILKGDIWTISVAGSLGGISVDVGDTVRALINTPGQTIGNWAIAEHNLGYTPENQANKDVPFGYCGLDNDGKIPVERLRQFEPGEIGGDITIDGDNYLDYLNRMCRVVAEAVITFDVTDIPDGLIFDFRANMEDQVTFAANNIVRTKDSGSQTAMDGIYSVCSVEIDKRDDPNIVLFGQIRDAV
jgi:hypothetical protein